MAPLPIAFAERSLNAEWHASKVVYYLSRSNTDKVFPAYARVYRKITCTHGDGPSICKDPRLPGHRIFRFDFLKRGGSFAFRRARFSANRILDDRRNPTRHWYPPSRGWFSPPPPANLYPSGDSCDAQTRRVLLNPVNRDHPDHVFSSRDFEIRCNQSRLHRRNRDPNCFVCWLDCRESRHCLPPIDNRCPFREF